MVNLSDQSVAGVGLDKQDDEQEDDDQEDDKQEDDGPDAQGSRSWPALVTTAVHW